MNLSHAHATQDDPWAEYEPDAAAPWDVRRVVHLHRRAGLGASWRRVEGDLADGPDRSIRRLLGGDVRPEGAPAPEEFERTAAFLAETAASTRDPGRLKAWWLYRLLFTPDPLGERLVLMWHNHFATAQTKVGDVALMLGQNATIRRLARRPFGELLGAMLLDPALLVFLDAPANRKGRPNENLARELKELFTLGLGHYSEHDVREVARALTGRTVADGAFADHLATHDGDVKTILGRSGRWDTEDIAKILLDHPATARRVAWRICDTFLGEGAVQPSAVRALGDSLRERGLDIDWGVATVLRSRAFFAERNLGTRVVLPAEFIAWPLRALELLDPPPSTMVLADWCARLGQDLFEPPNVGGWPGGRAWLSPRSLIGRVGYAAALAAGDGIGRERSAGPLALARTYGRGAGRRETIVFLCRLLLGVAPGERWLDRLDQAIGEPSTWDEDLARRALVQILASPEAQLG